MYKKMMWMFQLVVQLLINVFVFWLQHFLNADALDSLLRAALSLTLYENGSFIVL